MPRALPAQQSLLRDQVSCGWRAPQGQQKQDTTLQGLVLLRWNVRVA